MSWNASHPRASPAPHAASFTEADLRRALEDCFVPALHRSVVAAGLVRSATLLRDAEAPGAGILGVPERWVARVLLSSPAGEETADALLRAAVENRLLGLPSILRAEVSVVPPLFPILNPAARR